MSSPEALIRATLISLVSRFGTGLARVSDGFQTFAKEAPDLMRQELDSFQEEVFAEAERIDNASSKYSYEYTKEGESVQKGKSTPTSISDVEAQIDVLRAKVSELCLKIEGRP